MKTLYWLVKREFWEHRGGFFWAPVITGVVFLILNLMGIVAGEMFGLHHGITIGYSPHGDNSIAAMIESIKANHMQDVGSTLDVVMLSSSFLISVVFSFVVFFYCLGALYDDRRDRSFLFWKSLPISDSATVISKVITATLAAPVVAVVSGVLTGIAMLLMFAIALSFHGVSVWSLLMLAHPVQVTATLIGSIPMYLIWALPTVGWLMFCSAWAKSKPFLWAVIVPVGVGIVISWFNVLGSMDVQNTWYWRNVFVRSLFSVFPGGWFHIAAEHQFGPDAQPTAQNIADFFSLSNSYAALASPNVWIGAVLGLAMLAGAIWFRRWRDDS
ncbi:hypothetical protein [Dyella psychrodurans]|uniref:Uncharacterized protein n=1 Tax=Dyella psychrodurans TaxID=1927960 RepID=A0A370XDW0_9GAMM|nr:hypothetical protein [Dyella psychrodurans]RDS86467.1 hypothetical protein DWU99_04310 [Dyella psychrodurans]